MTGMQGKLPRLQQIPLSAEITPSANELAADNQCRFRQAGALWAWACFTPYRQILCTTTVSPPVSGCLLSYMPTLDPDQLESILWNFRGWPVST